MKTLQKEQGSAHVIIIVVLIVAVLGLLGFVFWQNFIAKKDTPKADTASTSTASTSTPTPTPDVKNYQNNTAGISLNYPSSWTLSEDTSDPTVLATITSPSTASKKGSSPDTTNYDVTLEVIPKSGSTNGSTSSAILALTGNAAEYASMKYTETINSIPVTEYNMNAQSPYFAAIFPVGNNYVELDFLTAPTKADLSADLTKILQSVKAL